MTNEILSSLCIDLHTIIGKYNRKILHALPKDQLMKYNLKYFIKAVFGINYDLPRSQLFKNYNRLSQTKNIYMGYNYVIVRCIDGTLMAYGDNFHGQLGLGDRLPRKIFETIKGIPKNIVDIMCGPSHVFIKCSDGKLLGCGNNGCGQLGLGDTNDRLLFREVKGIPKNIINIVCGEYHTILIGDGILMATGLNSYGQLGLGDNKDRCLFEEIKRIPKNVVSVLCSERNTIIRLDNRISPVVGTLMFCGHNKLFPVHVNPLAYSLFEKNRRHSRKCY